MIYKVLVKKPEIYKEVIVNDDGTKDTVERIRWREEWIRVEREMTREEIEEMDAQQAELPEPEPSPDERLAELEAQNQMLTKCLMEMSQIVYA